MSAPRTDGGRVQVERLIKGIERTDAAMKPLLDPRIVAELRTLLGCGEAPDRTVRARLVSGGRGANRGEGPNA